MLVKKAPFLAGVGGGAGSTQRAGFVHNDEGIRVGMVVGGLSVRMVWVMLCKKQPHTAVA